MKPRINNSIIVRVKDQYKDKIDPIAVYYYLDYVYQSNTFRYISKGSCRTYITINNIKSLIINGIRINKYCEIFINSSKITIQPYDIAITRVSDKKNIGKCELIK